MAGAGAAAPDVADAAVGWRAWKIRSPDGATPELISPVKGGAWPAGAATSAACSVDPGHRPPHDGCGCGLYAVTSPARVMGVHTDGALGLAALWGSVVEGTDGWRASLGYPRLLVVGPGVAEHTRSRLAREYRVPVHRSPVALPELVALLDTHCRREADGLRRGTTTWTELEQAVTANRGRVPPAPPYPPLAATSFPAPDGSEVALGAAGAVGLAGLVPLVLGGLFGLLLRTAPSPWLAVPVGIVVALLVLAAAGVGAACFSEAWYFDAPSVLVFLLGVVHAGLAADTVRNGWQPPSGLLIVVTVLLVIGSWTAVLLDVWSGATPGVPSAVILLVVSALVLGPEALAATYHVPGPPRPALAPVPTASRPREVSLLPDSLGVAGSLVGAGAGSGERRVAVLVQRRGGVGDVRGDTRPEVDGADGERA